MCVQAVIYFVACLAFTPLSHWPGDNSLFFCFPKTKAEEKAIRSLSLHAPLRATSTAQGQDGWRDIKWDWVAPHLGLLPNGSIKPLRLLHTIPIADVKPQKDSRRSN